MNVFNRTTPRKRFASRTWRLMTSLILCGLFANLCAAQQRGLLYDNGAFINRPGQGPGGADLCVVPSGWGVWGIPAVEYYEARVADDFTIPAGETWNITSARFFLYEYGTTDSWFTRMSLRIWDGSPMDADSHVIWGDKTASVMSDSGFTGAYHYAADYPSGVASVMWLDADANVTLPAGTYWFDWATSLSDYSRGDPHQGSIPADLVTRTGNALSMPFVGKWGQLTDAGRPLDYPFQVFGVVPEPSTCWLIVLGFWIASFSRFNNRKQR